MISSYPGPKLRNLRKRANLTQKQVVELTGISETTIHYLEHGIRRPQTSTLDKLLNLYAIRIKRLENLDRIWGQDGLAPFAGPQPEVDRAKQVNGSTTAKSQYYAQPRTRG